MTEFLIRSRVPPSLRVSARGQNRALTKARPAWRSARFEWTLDGQLAVKKLCYLWLERDIFCEPVWWCSVLRGSFLPNAVDCIATVAIVTDLMNFERVARVVVAPWWLGIWHFCDFLTDWTQRSVGSLVILSPTRWMTVVRRWTSFR